MTHLDQPVEVLDAPPGQGIQHLEARGDGTHRGQGGKDLPESFQASRLSPHLQERPGIAYAYHHSTPTTGGEVPAHGGP
jgi:hypothetical protein